MLWHFENSAFARRRGTHSKALGGAVSWKIFLWFFCFVILSTGDLGFSKNWTFDSLVCKCKFLSPKRSRLNAFPWMFNKSLVFTGRAVKPQQMLFMSMDGGGGGGSPSLICGFPLDLPLSRGFCAIQLRVWSKPSVQDPGSLPWPHIVPLFLWILVPMWNEKSGTLLCPDALGPAWTMCGNTATFSSHW